MGQLSTPRSRPLIGTTHLLLLISVALLGLVTFGQLGSQGLWAAELQDFAHGPVFGLLALLVLALLRRVATGLTSVYWD